MRCQGPALLVLVFMPLAVGATGQAPPPSPPSSRHPPEPLPAPRLCSGDYADDLSFLSARARNVERQAKGQATYCVRNTVVYECLSYGSDGNLRKTRHLSVSHGTAFAYKHQEGETLLLTNQHVAESPPVTDEDHVVSNVPAGCKRVLDTLKIVDSESDAYERDDIPLTNLVSDPALDMAVLKTHGELPVMAWRVGRSASLRERNVVEVRGFPLGAFNATTVGKVISAHDHDDFKDWNHDDFVVDALLSPGNSGSPVLAVSCHTGEFELVGVYHAAYTGGNALNVVVGIDQLHELMTTQKQTPRANTADAALELDGKVRARLHALAHVDETEPFFPFGRLAAAMRSREDGAFIFEVLNREFPTKPFAILAFEDLPAANPSTFGTLGRVWVGNPQGLRAYARDDLDGETLALLNRLLDGLRQSALASFNSRAAARVGMRNREEFNQVSRLEQVMRRLMAAHRELSQAALELAERLAPRGTDAGLTLSDTLVLPSPRVQGPTGGEGRPEKPAPPGGPAPVPVKTTPGEETPSASPPSTAFLTPPRPLAFEGLP